jgi:hypothetical protein
VRRVAAAEGLLTVQVLGGFPNSEPFVTFLPPCLLDALETALLALLIRRGADLKADGGLSWTIGPTLECWAKDGGRISIDLSRLHLQRQLAAFRIPSESGTRLQAPTVLRPYEGLATSAHERTSERAILLNALGPDAEILLC